ncbi:hypothetical protein NL449_28305, partial [Klebsiella pneumoniae]|nr:hypothetical protein [Klebsiella pneumoniae]
RPSSCRTYSGEGGTSGCRGQREVGHDGSDDDWSWREVVCESFACGYGCWIVNQFLTGQNDN